MKNKITFFFLLGVLLTFNTCHKEDLCRYSCYPGDCVDGTCICPVDYELDANGSCIESICVGINCVNSWCEHGICKCNAGYEPDTNGDCTVVSREKFIGTYKAHTLCPETGHHSFNTNIVAGEHINEVKIAKFNYFSNLVGTIHGGDSLYISKDAFFATGVYSTNAAGKGVITFTYWNFVFDGVSWLPVIAESCNSYFTQL